MMGAVKLELSCPKSAHGISIDPDPDWSFHALLEELNSLENKIVSSSSAVLVPFTKTRSREMSAERGNRRREISFIMRVSDDELDGFDDKHYERSLEMKRFACDDLYLSDSDDLEDEFVIETQFPLMEKAGVAEGALFELKHEHQLEVEEDIRNRISALETDLMGEYAKASSAFVRIEKYKGERRKWDSKLDTQYQRKIAEALDKHLQTVQEDQEKKSQIEAKKIRSDAAAEEARRKEKAILEEKMRQEKAKAEAEERRKLEEEKKAALEAEGKAKLAAETEAAKAKKNSEMEKKEILKSQQDASASTTTELKKVKAADNVVKAADSSLKLEQRRLLKIRELDELNQAFKAQQDFSGYERKIWRSIRQIGGSTESVRTKSNELIRYLNDPHCPQSISFIALATQIVSRSESQDLNTIVFACAQVIVRVTSQIPNAMEIILAEFHRACIYTIPKHISFSKSAFVSDATYYKAIGYRETNGEIESTDSYKRRLENYVKYYAALVQTEIPGVQNIHGLEEGWAWLARLLNAVPPNTYSALALNSFLQVAGYALYRKYRSQFQKILNTISHDFLSILKARDDQEEVKVIAANIQAYIDDRVYLKEPEGRRLLQGDTLSNTVLTSTNQYYR